MPINSHTMKTQNNNSHTHHAGRPDRIPLRGVSDSPFIQGNVSCRLLRVTVGMLVQSIPGPHIVSRPTKGPLCRQTRDGQVATMGDPLAKSASRSLSLLECDGNPLGLARSHTHTITPPSYTHTLTHTHPCHTLTQSLTHTCTQARPPRAPDAHKGREPQKP